MKKLKYLFIILLSSFSILFILNLKANASSEVPFNINVIHSSDSNKNINYIDITAKPNTSHEISFELHNYSKVERNFIIEANNATTSNGPSIDYLSSHNALIGHPQFLDMLQSKDKKIDVSIPGKHTKKISFNIKTPEKQFDGIVMGGVSMYENSKKDAQIMSQDNNSNNKSFSIRNKFVYSIATIIRNNHKKIEPNLQFNNVEQSVENYSPVVKTAFENNRPNYIRRLSTNSVIKDSNNKVVKKHTTNLGQVAPNSKFNIFIPFKNTLPTGNYTLYGTAKDGDGHSWKWQKSFNITSANFDYINKNVVKEPMHYNMTIILLIILIIILIAIIIYLIVRRKKSNS
ncbi:DUF3324 domain-containing protein [Apilactobacillus ozensis]|uniref:DUF3324 domain-containing protein n=1 Tax=Apilactobacillus ozensis TaxID=866801 RepID=UPI00200B0B7D|nr:DUF3324 domain-containing protein [Apilactobacillus ozensis]MCK8607397.1 DUF916 and DUF3324 domain-containing protein [Apilactobacillus ozensis]